MSSKIKKPVKVVENKEWGIWNLATGDDEPFAQAWDAETANKLADLINSASEERIKELRGVICWLMERNGSSLAQGHLSPKKMVDKAIEQYRKDRR